MAEVSKLSLQLLSNHINLIQLADHDLLRQSRKGGYWLPRDLERLVFNMFQRLLIKQITGLLGPKNI